MHKGGVYIHLASLGDVTESLTLPTGYSLAAHHLLSRILVSFIFFNVFLVANIACCIRNRNENENLAKLICCTCASFLPQSGKEGGQSGTGGKASRIRSRVRSLRIWIQLSYIALYTFPFWTALNPLTISLSPHLPPLPLPNQA